MLQFTYFYIPLLFALKTRFLKRSRWGVVVWISEYLIPVLLSLIILRWKDFSFTSSVLSIISVYNFYEIGYLQNDCETIKKESKPTLRLKENDLDYYEENKVGIYLIRLMLGFFFSIYYFHHGVPIALIIGLWSILPIYYLYNIIRGRINLYFIVVLTTFRFCYPLVLFGEGKFFDVFLLLIVFLSYPFPTFIIQCVEGKYGKSEKWATTFFFHDYNDRFLFRVKYYLLFCIIVTALVITFSLSWSLCVIPYYYLFTRSIQLKMPRLGPK